MAGGGWDGFAPVVPGGLGGRSASRTPGGTWARRGGFPRVPPKVLTVLHLLACTAKLGAPLLCPRLWVFLGASCG